MLASWYEFFSLAAMFKMPELFAGILRFDGVVTNSIGLYVIGGLSFPSLPVEFYLYSGP